MAERPQPASDSVRALTQYLVGQTTLRELLERVEELGRQAVTADVAGVTLVDEEGRARTAVFTDPTSPQIDSAQYESGHGPCMDAYRRLETIVVPSTEEETRWPAFARAAADRGVLSTLSLPLAVEGKGIGALNFYARRRDAFGADQVQQATVFAEHASVAIANAQAFWGAFDLSQQLQEAMASRATIEQAKGVLVAAQGCSPEEAFDILRQASQRSNRKLRDLAEEVVANAQKRKRGPGGSPASG